MCGFYSFGRDGKTQKGAKLMALGPMWRWHEGNKAINLAFWGPFSFRSFLLGKQKKRTFKLSLESSSKKEKWLNLIIYPPFR
jgi:hypothetical protein